ncbi:DnaT-like ssDNA-binding protein [Actibacterium sp. MT2.3-13A]|uniref:DnaT-like ssDNA-binding protein n=1 Tax=Actibacterium sp. MT2.3-13A TaxID=2828332 RepID=UPI001BA817D6|nr:DnaT-like ssDNA-binding protein [Actibacterium sp. MT2.3-13A]
MALVTTIGGASSDSYGTLADYQAYAASMGWTLSGVDATDEQNLRRATQVLDRGFSFIGYRQYQTQALAWPRIVSDLVKDWPVDADTIPQDIIDAQFEVAYLIQGGLDAFATITATVSRTRVKAGPVESETEYTGGKATPRLVAVEGLLGPYLKAGRGQIALVRA